MHTIALARRFAMALAISLPLASNLSSPQSDGARIYKAQCASCHDQTNVRAPDRDTLKLMSPESIVASLVSGTMAVQGQTLSAAEKRAVAEFLAGRPIESGPKVRPAGQNTACRSGPTPLHDPFVGPRWNGWGADLANTRFQPAAQAGIPADAVPKLKLKWAFGFPEGRLAYAQPTIAGGRVFVGGDRGAVYSLDSATGCTYWSHQAEAGVRTAITIGALETAKGAAPDAIEGRFAAYFGDLRANVYALDAATGRLIWSVRVDEHQAARISGTPVLEGSRLYVPVSSFEEAPAARANYECCRFRGSLVALDAATGKVIWRTYTIAQEPKPVKKNEAGTQLWAPAGAAIWSAPTIDVKRRTIYVGTGNAYTEPAPETTDAVLAFDMDTGRVRWSRQLTPSDTFIIGCAPGGNNSNCPQTTGPDYDIGTSPILRTLPGGRRILLVGQKSGVAYGLDPDKDGAIVWQFRAGKGGALGGIEWGIAADDQQVYVPVSDVLAAPQEAGGLYALRLATGEKVWHTPAPKLECSGGRGCTGAQSAPVTVVPGVVFSGSVDGHLRAYSTSDGRIIWAFNTAQEFPTVNGVKGNGGSIDAAGPTVAGGMLFTTSGYGQWRGMPGNVLLAFAVE
jgi:polyvinyl alcohol dehydrogenase (cytochrome)